MTAKDLFSVVVEAIKTENDELQNLFKNKNYNKRDGYAPGITNCFEYDLNYLIFKGMLKSKFPNKIFREEKHQGKKYDLIICNDQDEFDIGIEMKIWEEESHKESSLADINKIPLKTDLKNYLMIFTFDSKAPFDIWSNYFKEVADYFTESQNRFNVEVSEELIAIFDTYYIDDNYRISKGEYGICMMELVSE